MSPGGTSSILSVDPRPLDVPLHAPFGIAGGAQAALANVLVSVTLADGTVGLGEAAPLPAYNGETQESTLSALAAAKVHVEGRDATEWRAIGRLLQRVIGRAGAARCALETAILDALLRRHRMSFHAFFGGAGEPLETDVTITTGTAGEAWEAACRWSERGFRVFKVKVGAASPRDDLARALAVRDAAPSSRIFLDANASMTAADAIWLSAELSSRGVDVVMFEQPTAVGDWAALAEVGRHVAVVADENVVTAADALDAARLGPPHLINVKLMKSGIVEALDVASIARAAGMGLMIGGNVESALAMTVSASFAAGLGGFAHADLDTPLFLTESPFEGGLTFRGPVIELARDAPGHGVAPRRAVPG